MWKKIEREIVRFDYSNGELDYNFEISLRNLQKAFMEKDFKIVKLSL